VGGLIAFVMLIQMLMAGFSLFRKAEDPLYKGLGLGFLVAVCSCIVANCFGDRWTYVEINGLLWILAGATVRSSLLAAQAPAAAEQLAIESSTPSLAPHLEWR
jgi:putative inorganic carbon (HCO3(-)) transporter